MASYFTLILDTSEEDPNARPSVRITHRVVSLARGWGAPAESGFTDPNWGPDDERVILRDQFKWPG